MSYGKYSKEKENENTSLSQLDNTAEKCPVSFQTFIRVKRTVVTLPNNLFELLCK